MDPGFFQVAPGSGDYCASACEDECSALKADNGGEEVEGVRTARPEPVYTLHL
jgi:hypothetical protein